MRQPRRDGRSEGGSRSGFSGRRARERADAVSAPEPGASLLVLMGRLAGIGWYVALSIAGGVVGGVWLDRRFDTSPVLTLIGLGVGLAVAAAGIYGLLKTFFGNDAARISARGDDAGSSR